MPQEWNNQLVVTKEELVPLYYTNDSLDKQIQRYKKKEYGIKRVMIGGNGRQLLISFDSLDCHIRTGLGDPRKLSHILEGFYKVDGEAVSFYSTYKFPDGTWLDLEFQERYILNASVLKAIIALRQARITERKTKSGSLTGIMKTLVSDADTFNEILAKKHKAKHTLPPGEKQFAKVLKDFENLSYAGIISKKHKNKNPIKVTDFTIELLNNLFAGQSHKPTATQVHRQYSSFLDGYLTVINNATGEVYDPKEFKKLSTGTVTNYMAQWSNKIGNYTKRSGDRQKLMNQFKVYHSFDKVKYAGSMISIDDRQPPFKTLETGERIWFYNGIDLGSEAFTCWVYGDTKEGIILKFYQQMVRNYASWGFNLPHELECEMSLNSSFRETFLREGSMFQKVKMEANNARGKRIERYFGELRYRIEKERKGWLARPTAIKESNQAQIPIEKVPLVPFDEIVQGCLQDIENWNNQKHSVHTDKSRWEVFCEMQNPKLQPTNYASFLPHIGFKTPTSCNVGHIKLNNGLFLIGENGKVATGQRLIQIMTLVEGQDVDVYWLDDDFGNVIKAFAYIGTNLICEIVEKPTYSRAQVEQEDDDLDVKEIISKYVSTVDAYGRNQTAKIDKVTIIDNTPKPVKAFVMPGLRKTISNENYTPAETVEDDYEDEIVVPAINGFKSLKDRF